MAVARTRAGAEAGVETGAETGARAEARAGWRVVCSRLWGKVVHLSFEKRKGSLP